MTSDPDIFRAAKLLMDRHGEDAPLRAVERADAPLEAGDLIGLSTWRRIMAAIEELRPTMRASNEVTIDRQEFLAAVRRIPTGGLRRHARHIPRKTLIYADPPFMIVETPYVRSELSATGTWKQPAAVNARLLIKVASSLPKTVRVTLLYASGRLFFDRLSIEATPAAGMVPTKEGRLRPPTAGYQTVEPFVIEVRF